MIERILHCLLYLMPARPGAIERQRRAARPAR